MARICCVESCRAVPQEDITFFNFPIKQSLQKKWRDAIRPTETLSIESVICSRHFNQEDYETIRGKVRLKARVVPTIFNHVDSPKSPGTSQEDPKENGHTDSPITADVEPTVDEVTKQSAAVTSNCEDTSKDNEVAPAESVAEQGLVEDGHEDSHQPEYEVPIEFSCEVQLTEEDENETIECVPEAILHEHEDSDSHSEGDIHKEDIEDIIANYHIKQDPKLAERLKASQEKENLSNNQDSKSDECVSDKDSNNSCKVSKNSDKVSKNSGKEKSSGKKDSLPPDKDGDCIEVEVSSFPSSRKRRKPEFIEIPVDKDPADKSNDCLMLMENVQVDIDPSTLMFAPGDPDNDGDDSAVEIKSDEEVETDSKRKNDPISLLTSSDDDDVIIEEPHIDTVEVSDETDEDDVPLTRLVKSGESIKPDSVGKILWGTLSEYYCYKCRFTTTTHADYIRHRQKHEKVFNVCEICDFSTASKSQFVRHKRKHKEDKTFKCLLCDYKAKHHMSLIYHLKSHGIEERAARKSLDAKKSKCPNCKMYFTSIQNEFLKHTRSCVPVVKMHTCTKCKYKTRRSFDLKRHLERKHPDKRKTRTALGSDEDDEYEP